MNLKSYLERGIEVAKDVMRSEGNADSDWFVVGGAPRDVLLGNQFKDIDVFVSQPHTRRTSDRGSASLARGERFFQQHPVTGETFEINVIYMRGEWTMQGLADRCDVGICQVAVHPRTGEWYTSAAFEEDFANNTMTQTRETRSNHIEKLIKRWPDREYLNPENYGLDEPWAWHYEQETAPDTFTFV